jgi:Tol biopolymer transport system component
LQTIVYTVNGPQGPEIYRVQVDELGQKAGPVARIDFQTHPQIRILGLFPSPNGQQVAVGWLRDTGTTHVYILEVATGQLTPLFGQADIDQRATFLDWTPDSQSVLVMGGTANPDLGNSAWLVNVESHTYRDVNIKQINELPRIRDASFSPDGETIIYTHRDNIQGGSEIWKITLDETTPQLLIKNTKYRIENVLWSPEGDSIAFTQWSEDIKPSINEIRMGELHVIQQDGSQERTLSSIVIHADNQIFRPIWSPDGQQIAFVSSENLESGETLDTLSGNLYIANVSTNQIRQITRLERNVVIRPAWSPDSFEIAFLLKEQSQNQFDSQVIEINSAQLRQFGLNESLIETQINQVDGSAPNLDERSAIVWLP